MTDLEKRLAAAFSERDRQIEVDPEAWQTHLQMAQAVSRSSAVRRWRSPVLVAAAVVSLGLLGGILGQTGLAGLGTVSPAGPDHGSVAPAPTSSPAGGAPRSTSTTSQDIPPSVTGSVPGPASSDRSTTAPSADTSPALPPSVSSVSSASSAPLSSEPGTHGGKEFPPAAELTTTSAPPSLTSSPGVGTGIGNDHEGVVGSSDVGTWSREGTTTTAASEQILLTGMIPCGEPLPDVHSVVPNLTVEAGPDGYLVNDVRQPLPVLAVGFAIVTADGRIASVTSGHAELATVTAEPLQQGRSSPDHQMPLQPTAWCPEMSGLASTAASHGQGQVFRSPNQVELPPGYYRATTVVLLGEDLAHARAYRAGDIWQLWSG
jgi:hypothetical protein